MKPWLDAFAALLIVTLPVAVEAGQPAGDQTPVPDTALTARFAAFFTGVLAGHLPLTGVAGPMKSAFTPELIKEIDDRFAPLGAFRRLDFVREDAVETFRRYHYNAVFAKGSQPLMFVLNGNDEIAGFFNDAVATEATAPDSALTARFTGFLTDLLAARLPPTGISASLKTGLTPDLIAQVDRGLAPLGAFQSLQFVRADTAQGYHRYHYNAVFAKGSQPLMFVLDTNGDIAGFFKD